jgi:ATP-binding cassette, subfamily B, bacterial
MTYNLNFDNHKEGRTKPLAALKRLLLLLTDEKRSLFIALITSIIHAALTLTAPLIIGHTIDTYVQAGKYKGVLEFSAILLGIYIISLATSYFQTKLMGSFAQRVLFKLRNNIFMKIQDLPIAFFNENKAGDLISRINNDTDKLNQFFSQSLMQFMGSIFVMTGAGIFLLSINFTLGAAALVPAVVLVVFSRSVTRWVKRLNRESLDTTGNLSAEIQESISNFKVVVAFNRRDYFRKRFEEANTLNYLSALKAGLSNSIFIPVYGFFSNIGQLIVLAFGIYLISAGRFTLGLLISFLSYIHNFYMPLRQLAALWSSFQIAMAGWDRISRILRMESNLTILSESVAPCEASYLSFKNVSFSYPSGKEVLHKTNFDLERGKTYAFVGPTGGGKTTTASLISRLYDPVKGIVMLEGRDLRLFSTEERSKKIGFILQEPFLFTGTIRENIVYGNPELAAAGDEEILNQLSSSGLDVLLTRFDEGLDTCVINGGASISLGQKQLIAFIRAVLRRPEILILDEATANIDTLTEQQLELILKKLHQSTTRIVIAHRLNTIENADEIFFINGTQIIQAGSMEQAVQLLMQEKRES